jgi:hypothetical protein
MRGRRGERGDERGRRLESIPGWTWEEGFAHLAHFARREGHSQVPKSYKDDQGFRLGLWVRNQRSLGARGPRRNVMLSRLDDTDALDAARFREPDTRDSR